MDRDRFDALARVLATSASRRAAIVTLLGGGLAGGSVAGRERHGANRATRGGRDRVRGEAACGSPRHGANMNGCNFNGRDFSGDDLSAASMVGTTFNDATLIGTNLSSSNLRDAKFRRANLCWADLSSAILRGTDFTNANLTGANLRSSSGCNTAIFSGATFCHTVMCNGAVRNDHCPGGGPVCCGGICECGGGICADDECCKANQCVAGGQWNQCGAGGDTCEACAAGEVCNQASEQCASCASQTGLTACDGFVSNAGPTPGAQCGPAAGLCACAEVAAGGSSVCWTSPVHCNIPGSPCTTPEGACPPGLVCVRKGSCDLLNACAGETVCVPLCGDGDPDANSDGKVDIILPA
ncbi:MAG: pentapeptide repeat-containing protein [Thermomicrobiales bacterium]